MPAAGQDFYGKTAGDMEKLRNLSVAKIRELAKEKGISLKKTSKEEIIAEFLESEVQDARID